MTTGKTTALTIQTFVGKVFMYHHLLILFLWRTQTNAHKKEKNLSYAGAQQLLHPLNVTYGSCLKELLGEGIQPNDT